MRYVLVMVAIMVAAAGCEQAGQPLGAAEPAATAANADAGGGDVAAAGGVDLANLPVNTWVEFQPTFRGAPLGGRYIAVGWNKMVYDSKGARALIMDRWMDSVRDQTIYANAAIAVNPAKADAEVLKLNNYKRKENPGGRYSTVAMEAELAADPTPADRHPYGCLAYCDFDDSLYLGPGANRTWKVHPRDFWRLDLATRKWHKLPEEGAPEGGKANMLESAMCYDPAARLVVFYNARSKTTHLFDVAGKKWLERRPEKSPAAGMGAAMAYDTKRHVAYLFGGPGAAGKDWNTPGAELWAYSAETNAWRRLADSPVPARAPAIAYDSKHDILLASVTQGDRPNAIVLYRPETNTWAPLRTTTRTSGAESTPADTSGTAGAPASTSGAGRAPADTSGAQGAPATPGAPKSSWMCLCYDSARDVFIYKAGNYDETRWFVFRYSPGQAPQ